MSYRSLIACLALLLTASGFSHAQPVRTDYVESELIAETTSIQPGQPFWVALRMKMDDHWHTYWRNPGDSGMPTAIQWTLPDGFQAGPIQWPFPQAISLPPLVSYGYEGEVFLLTEITPSSALSAGSTVDIQAYATWLVCKDICLPGEAGYALSLPVTAEAPPPDARWTDAFAQTRAHLPISSSEWRMEAAVNDSLVQIHAAPPAWFAGDLSRIDFFPFTDTLIDHAAPQRVQKTASGYLVSARRSTLLKETPAEIQGVLVAPEGWRGAGSERALAFTAPVAASLPAAIATASTGAPDEVAGPWTALLFAFAGGVLLNLMPCVLPVLSIKVLGFVHQAGGDHAKGWYHGAVFTAGVLASFLALAGGLIALRAGGEQLGWGFQLQSPVFLVVLSSFLFLFGLSLFGVFEIGASLAGLGGRLDTGTGLGGSFISGVTATVVATPCTAPFMGPALGYALIQPPVQALSIFAALGLGMAAPYLMLSSVPSLLRFVPRPGAWMVSFKQFMGFLMMATVVWLVWVLGIQTGPDMVGLLLGTFVLLGVGAWMLGRWGGVMATTRRRIAVQALAAALMIGGLAFTLSVLPPAGTAAPPDRTTAGASGLAWQPFSQQQLEALRAAGKPVFIDFTAAWCLSCQVNERLTFYDRRVVEAFDRLGVTALKADWTARDPEITAALARFGRNSVPLYVLYTGDAQAEPLILPALITPGIVLEALEKVEAGTTAGR